MLYQHLRLESFCLELGGTRSVTALRQLEASMQLMCHTCERKCSSSARKFRYIRSLAYEYLLPSVFMVSDSAQKQSRAQS
jgi:hypothetical protein